MMLQRSRVQAALARAARKPVTLVVAPAGSGKSVAIRQLLETKRDGVLWFDVRTSHTSLTRFVRGFAAALEPHLPKLGQSLAIAHERAMQSPSPAAVLAAWLAEHLGETPFCVVIDGYHHCEHDGAIAEFVAGAIERTRGTARWFLASRSIDELPLATWLARGDATVPIDFETLRLDPGDAERLAAELAPGLEASIVRRLALALHGSIGKTTFALRTAAQDASVAERVLAAAGDAYAHFVDEALAALDEADRRFVCDTALFPDLSRALLEAAGYADGAASVARLEATVPQIFETRVEPKRYVPLFIDVLADRVAGSGADASRSAFGRIGLALEASGRTIEALAFYIRGRDLAELARTVDAQALALVESGFGESVQEAIEQLDPMVQTTSAVILATKATFESRLGRFDTAESWFQLALERAAGSAAGDRIAYHYGSHLIRFFRPEAIALLEGLANKEDATADLRCYARSALGPAYVSARRVGDACTSSERALASLHATSPAHLRARTYHQSAYVALYASDGMRARLLAEKSLAIANECGFFDIAAGALTVLYNAAADIDDDPIESMRLLDAVADCAAKSGSLVNHLLASIAKLEIEVERGDDEAIARLDDKLMTLDVRSSGRAAYEAFLPAQALRAAWTSDFAGAYRLLAASADLQWSEDRKALRFAEIATYAAAAGLATEATTALRASLELLESIPVTPRIVRTRLFAALAMVLLGRGEAAAEQFGIVDVEPAALSSRMRALRRALGALADRYRGERNHEALLYHFESLTATQFGGIARLLEAAPMRDNASLRRGELTSSERLAVTHLVRGTSVANDRALDAIVAKLGCVDQRALRRALARDADFSSYSTRLRIAGNMTEASIG